jgi:hypothetical protein
MINGEITYKEKKKFLLFLYILGITVYNTIYNCIRCIYVSSIRHYDFSSYARERAPVTSKINWTHTYKDARNHSFPRHGKWAVTSGLASASPTMLLIARPIANLTCATTIFCPPFLTVRSVVLTHSQISSAHTQISSAHTQPKRENPFGCCCEVRV